MQECGDPLRAIQCRSVRIAVEENSRHRGVTLQQGVGEQQRITCRDHRIGGTVRDQERATDSADMKER